ncbi:MAG: lipoyl(octanoyl) transferase LipB [Candidatus Neomarinimicrobiota bacterium]|nr:lipoyl(octanoyl) transferase LipB [Candidatus Neomarinimicrobiota bacterium]MEE3302030.1 lipoyl(octanoyl) transferase LipB [Candidatus Neomarinimicrobiota bacterium]
MDFVVKDLGVCDYNKALLNQKNTKTDLINNLGKDTLFLLEHDHTYTLGKNANPNNILNQNCELFQTDRGGDVTYHGPGQLVGYPIIHLKKMGLGIKSYVSKIEILLIHILNDYDIVASTREGLTGVWVNDRKIASIGIRVSQWVTTHGFSLNVNTDMSYFSNIISCGIDNIAMTSMEQELKRKISMDDIKQSTVVHFNQLFK